MQVFPITQGRNNFSVLALNFKSSSSNNRRSAVVPIISLNPPRFIVLLVYAVKKTSAADRTGYFAWSYFTLRFFFPPDSL